MSMKQMFAVLRHKGIPASSWKAEGPGGKSYKVIEHKREFVPSALNCGRITFVVQVDNDATNQEVLVGLVGKINDGQTAMIPDGSETITRNGTALPEPNIDGGVAGVPVLHGFPPKLKLRGQVIVKFQYQDSDEDDGIAEYRFEGKFGEINMI